MKAYPEKMLTALLLHNNIMQKERWNNFGYVLEQEGGKQPYQAQEGARFVSS
jgi:hypothetical protein